MLKPSVQVRDEGGTLTAEFWDCLRLDPAPVQQVRKDYEAHLRRKGRPDLVVDLNGVSFAGSAALGGFLAIHRVARQNGGHLIFCNVDPTVREVFRVSKIESLFTFVEDKPAALALAERNATGADGADGEAPKPPAPRPEQPRGDSPLRGRRKRG